MVTYCKNERQAQFEIAEWLSKAVGRSFRGNWGNQCVTLVQGYCREIFGRDPYTTLGYGNANQHLDNGSSSYFHKYYYQSGFKAEPGDIMVWAGPAPLWDGRYYGHTGVAMSSTATQVTVVNQDGAKAPVARYADGNYYSHAPAYRSTFGYASNGGAGRTLGWLRPKWDKVVYTGADIRAKSTVSVVTGGQDLPEFKLETAETPNYTASRSHAVSSVTIHWWGDPKTKPTHDGVVSWFANPNSRVSAHYTVSKGRVTRQVHPSFTAWHAGSSVGNGSSIGIECDPSDPEGTLPTVAALIRQLNGWAGKELEIKIHSDWNNTACPGDYKPLIPKLKAMVKTGKVTGDIVALSNDDVNKIAKAVSNAILQKRLPKRGLEKFELTVEESLAWQGDSRNKVSRSDGRLAKVEQKLDAVARAVENIVKKVG